MNTKLQRSLIMGAMLMLSTSASAAMVMHEEWTLQNVFTMPESAALDPVGQQIYVSNVNGYAKDGNGFISRVSTDGKQVEVGWLPGLNSPTGLAVQGEYLYAVDYDELLIIDIASGTVNARIPAPHDKPALNDVAISSNGRVFVTGSSSSSIYELRDNKLQVWMQDEELLRHANGLLVDGDRLVYGGTNWLIFDLRSKEIAEKFVVPEPSITEIDGISSDACGGYFVTLIDDDRLWHIDQDGTTQPVSEQAIKGIDLDHYDGKLYVPVVGGSLTVYRMEMLSCKGQNS